MDLLSVFRRKTPATEAPAAADAVLVARTRARQRLIGAAVLVVAGIIGFPLLFETQPRPISVDVPIEIPRKDKVPPLVMPAASPDTPASTRRAELPARSEPVAGGRVITETEAEAGREVVAGGAPASAPVLTEPARPRAASAPTPKASAPAARASAPAAPPAADGARAQALLDGNESAAPSPAASGPARFVVQVGAFTDAAAVKDVRAKVEKLGMKTYTQVADTPAGARTRVRVGPFPTRDDADRAAAKIKSASLPAIILAL